MRLVYSDHARRRMRQRAISEQDIESVVADPDIEHTDENGNPCYVGYPGGRRLRVVIARGSNPRVVKTAIADLPEAAQ